MATSQNHWVLCPRPETGEELEFSMRLRKVPRPLHQDKNHHYHPINQSLPSNCAPPPRPDGCR